MGSNSRQEALRNLLNLANKQGYITFDDVMDSADANLLPIQDFDWLTNSLTTNGVLIYDEVPKNINFQDDDDYDDFAQRDYEAIYSRIIELDESLAPFIAAVKNIVPPQWREFSQLKYQVIEGNQHARERMIEMHLRIAIRIALQRAENYDMDIQDAVGEACVGLITAVDKYNPDANGAFGSYAAMWVLQCITRRQTTKRPLVYYPVHKKEVYFSGYPILKEIGYADDNELYEKDEVKRILEDKAGLTPEQVDEILVASDPFESLDELSDSLEENSNLLKYFIYDAEIEEIVAEKMLRLQLREVLGTLTEREQRVLELRYGLKGGVPRTLEEVGAVFSVTRERVRQIEAKALRKLRHPSRSRKLKDFWDFTPNNEKK